MSIAYLPIVQNKKGGGGQSVLLTKRKQCLRLRGTKSARKSPSEIREEGISGRNEKNNASPITDGHTGKSMIAPPQFDRNLLPYSTVSPELQLCFPFNLCFVTYLWGWICARPSANSFSSTTRNGK